MFNILFHPWTGSVTTNERWAPAIRRCSNRACSSMLTALWRTNCGHWSTSTATRRSDRSWPSHIRSECRSEVQVCLLCENIYLHVCLQIYFYLPNLPFAAVLYLSKSLISVDRSVLIVCLFSFRSMVRPLWLAALFSPGNRIIKVDKKYKSKALEAIRLGNYV